MGSPKKCRALSQYPKKAQEDNNVSNENRFHWPVVFLEKGYRNTRLLNANEARSMCNDHSKRFTISNDVLLESFNKYGSHRWIRRTIGR
jgi:hypothetical protein